MVLHRGRDQVVQRRDVGLHLLDLEHLGRGPVRADRVDRVGRQFLAQPEDVRDAGGVDEIVEVLGTERGERLPHLCDEGIERIGFADIEL